MQLIAYDLSRVILLVNTFRREGQPYLPEAAAKVVQRYSFAKFPTVDDLQKDAVSFAIGRFEDVQITELSVYADGIIASANCNTALLDRFISDVMKFAEKEVGLVPLKVFPAEKHFECGVLVQSETDLAAALAPSMEVRRLISEALGGQVNARVQYQCTGTIFDVDAAQTGTRRKPGRLVVERRAGRPFSDNLFYCQAPTTTDRLLALLTALEESRST